MSYNKLGKMDPIKKYFEGTLESKIKLHIYPAILFTTIATILAVFPWPKTWEIGTSLYMRISIVVLVLIADYHWLKTKQFNNLLFKEKKVKIKATLVSVVSKVAYVITFVGMFALFYKG